MAKEKSAVAGSFWQEMLQFSVYKRSQGRIARQLTGAALALVFAIGAYQLTLAGLPSGAIYQYGVPAVVLALGLWFSFRVVNLPRFADFLIAVEAEMNKVSWPSRGELIRSSIVVIVVIFALAFLLGLYDVLWGMLFSAIGVVRGE